MSLEIDRVSVGYGRDQILFDVSAQARAGEVVVLLGRNGAGKSTTLKTAIGTLRPTSGRIRLYGEDITAAPVHARVQKGLAYVPEDRRIFANLTVAENLLVGQQPPRPQAATWTVERVLDLFPKLKDLLHRRGGQMSGGEQQMLTIARALLGHPRALLLDEPSEGLAPVIVERIAQAILELKREGLAILLSEQNLHFAMLVSDRVVVLERGHVRFSDTVVALKSTPSVSQQYLAL